MAEALRAKIDRKSAISLHRGHFDPKFQVEGVAPPVMFAPIVRPMNTLTTLPLTVFTQKKLCSRLSSSEVRSESLSCSLDGCKIGFYSAAHSIFFGKIGRTASEEVVLQLISIKCMPILLYGLEAFSLYNYQLKSLDFVINRFFMKTV